MTVVIVATGVAASATDADAGPRKRLVVLPFEGPKAENFHDDLVKLLKKNNTVISDDKWSSTADDLSAAKPTDKNIKKVAKKLKIDGVIEGTIEKRRDTYIIRLKLHEGKTGAVVGKDIDAKATGSHLEGDALKDIKDELNDAVDALAGNRPTELGDDSSAKGDDDDAPKPKHKKPAGDDDDDAPKPKHKKPAGDDDDDTSKPKHGGFSHHDDDAKGGDKVTKPKGDDDDAAPKPKHKKPTGDDDDATPPPKPKHKKPTGEPAGDDDDGGSHHHKPKSGDDDGGTPPSGDDDSGPEAWDPVTLTEAARAMDAAFGLSLTDRKLTFASAPTLANPPPGYKGVPVAGLDIDLTVYPLAVTHKRHDMLANIGLNLLIDRVLKVSSQTSFMDNGMTLPANLATEELRVGVGAVFRYPLGTGPLAPVIGGMLRYGKQQFIISHDLNGQMLPVGVPDVPNVHYSMIELGPFIKFPVSPKLTLKAKADFIVVTDGGDITSDSQYGGGHVTAFELEGGIDYALSNAIFVRATARIEQFRFTFNGTGEMTSDRSVTPTTPPQNVNGANDTYYGGTILLGFLY